MNLAEDSRPPLNCQPKRASDFPILRILIPNMAMGRRWFECSLAARRGPSGGGHMPEIIVSARPIFPRTIR
jgi:hypothetical protein